MMDGPGGGGLGPKVVGAPVCYYIVLCCRSTQETAEVGLDCSRSSSCAGPGQGTNGPQLTLVGRKGAPPVEMETQS